jgi:PAS domain S-box-containing protein
MNAMPEASNAETGPDVSARVRDRKAGPVLRAVSPAAGATVAAVAGVHLVGWLTGVMAQRGAAAITMKTNAALSLLLLGMALIVLATPQPGAARRWLGRICAGVALAIAALTLSENLVGWDLGIDQLIAIEAPGARGVLSPNRMGSPGSLSITLAGISLLLLARRRSPSAKAVQGLAVGVCLVGLLPTLGYLYGVRGLYALERVTAVAWPTALCIITLGLGILLARPLEGPIAQVTVPDAGGTVVRRLLLPLLLLPVGLGWLAVTGERLGLLEPPMATALLVLTFIVSLSALTWLAGRRGSRAAEALRRYELVVQESRDIILFIRRSDGRILEANRAATEAYGYSRAELLAMTIQDLRAPATLDEVESHMGDADVRGVLFETVHQRRDGSTFPAEVSSRGALIGDVRVLVSVVRDSTARKGAESALREANERLREADERKNEFLAVLSHELRNPLGPIRSGLHVIEHAAFDSEASRRAREVIARQTRQLSRLVDDLLDVVRVSRNKIRLRKASIDLNEVVRRTVEDHRPLFDDHRLDVQVRMCAQPLPVVGDEARLAQVVGNLLHNAMKFTPAGGRVEVATARCAADSRAALRVTDTGVGIDRATLAHIFEPFTQADTAIDRSKGGLGLGLALVKSLVEMHGGSVRAESEGAGLGTEFVVELPLEHEARPASLPVQPATASGRRRVLVIEDNADARETLKMMLELGGHVVCLASDGPRGLAAARDFGPDVVFCDIGLPAMDGFDVARAFRADDRMKAVALVALTGYARHEDVVRARAAGFDRHLSKPASPETIQAVLAEFPRATRSSAGEPAKQN